MEARWESPATNFGDGRLWAIALAVSLFGNLAIFALTGLAVIDFRKWTQPPPVVEAAKPATTLLLPAELFITEAATVVSSVPKPQVAKGSDFARTSEDQLGKRPDSPAFFGERNTEATSDRTPDPSAVPLPSQAGIEPRHEGDLETTDSRYRDGGLEPADASPDVATVPSEPSPVPPPAEAPPQPEPPAALAETREPAPEAVKPAELLSGPNPVDVPVSRPAEKPSMPASAAPVKPAVAEQPPVPKPKPSPAEPEFKGNQHKTALVGSISRTGRSALDVVDSPLGRYQAVISRAVELEWQRNCVRHRDFITPGFLTVRFFVEPTGKVRKVEFVGEMETGEVQKGFTLNSIRDAKIPAMPPAVKKEFAKDPLELMFNFYF